MITKIDDAERWLDKKNGIPRVPMLNYTKCRSVQKNFEYEICDNCVYRFHCWTKSDKGMMEEGPEFRIPR